MVHVAGDAGFSRAELDQLYRRHAPSVFRRARRLLGRDADAWDAVQEVFQKMVTAHQSFRGEARPMTWLYRITTNISLNMLRSRSLREPAGLTVIDGHADDGQEALETRNLLQAWLKGLTEREQEIATLLFIDGLTQEEVADVLELSRKTINREVAELRAKAAALGALPEGDS
ncbi:MAG: sigma-70 family RNA polymerase sigma factor [Archangiaceae bacterium]|nr:sigma-70 family RNA polymerase sigma factor [Archangiaceae bacterium]